MRSGLLFAAGLALFLAALPARADICKAPFMHNDGRLLLTGSGLVKMGADLAFSDFVQKGQGRCQVRVRGNTTFGFMAFPASESELDYLMSVDKGSARFESIGADGRRKPVEGRFDLRLLGLFAYGEPISRAGQTFDAQAYKIKIDKKNPDAAPLVIRTGQKTVGEQALIQTAAGEQSCWPVRYSRDIEAVTISVSKIQLPLPGIKSEVTDWFCPAQNMVMKQESVQAGVPSLVEVTGMH